MAAMRSAGDFAITCRVRAAAAAFDARHLQLSARAQRVLLSVPRAQCAIECRRSFEVALNELRWNRFYVEERLGTTAAIAARERKAEGPATWRLEDSIWAPRAKQGPAFAFYDTEEVRTPGLAATALPRPTCNEPALSRLSCP